MDPVGTVTIRHLGRSDYPSTWAAMRAHNENAPPEAADEIWVTEHPPVFTLGRNARPEHLLTPGDIPVIHCDRGGQVTYHGPGQLVVYLLIDLRRRGLGIRDLVNLMENALIDTLAHWGIPAHARPDAPGVYVDEAKIASLGLRIRRGRSYHGLALNVAMDLEPFTRINPCGHAGLPVTQLRDLGIDTDLLATARILLPQLTRRLPPAAVPPRHIC